MAARVGSVPPSESNSTGTATKAVTMSRNNFLSCLAARTGLALVWLLITNAALAQNPAADRPRPSRPNTVASAQWEVAGTRGAVVAGGQEAVEAGIEVLRSGANAADAAVATW